MIDFLAWIWSIVKMFLQILLATIVNLAVFFVPLGILYVWLLGKIDYFIAKMLFSLLIFGIIAWGELKYGKKMFKWIAGVE
ncbi:MAG: hypothetical protein MJ113_00260 [Lachnospiraceae bacterium]|nr:hypothetical protein [Lachnospiraceae bacterium]